MTVAVRRDSGRVAARRDAEAVDGRPRPRARDLRARSSALHDAGDEKDADDGEDDRGDPLRHLRVE